MKLQLSFILDLTRMTDHFDLSLIKILNKTKHTKQSIHCGLIKQIDLTTKLNDSEPEFDHDSFIKQARTILHAQVIDIFHAQGDNILETFLLHATLPVKNLCHQMAIWWSCSAAGWLDSVVHPETAHWPKN